MLYHDIIYRNREQPEKQPSPSSPADIALSAQQRVDWITNPRTQQIFQELYMQIATLENEARSIACGFETTPNTHGLVSRLVRASELRKLLENYGRLHETT